MNVAAPVDSAPRHVMTTMTTMTTPLEIDSFKEYAINKSVMTVGSGEQRVSHVTHCNGFVGYVIESVCAPEVPETWVVCVVHEASGDQAPTKVLSHSSTALGPGSKPTSIHISEDDVLALSLGAGGLVTYGLHYDGFNAQAYELYDLGMPGHYQLYCKWIAMSNEGHCLVSRVQNSLEDSLWVHSCVKGRRNTQDLLKATVGTILEVDAAAPGNIAALLYTHKIHTLTRSYKGDFVQRTINLESLVPGTTPVCVAIGNQMLMVSLLCAPTTEKQQRGDLLCFNLRSGEVTNRRQCNGVATAMATDGSRCLFGVTCPEESALYCLYQGKDTTFTFSDDIGEMVWTQGSVYIDYRGWSCGVTYHDDQYAGWNTSVVEYCTARLSRLACPLQL
jgi:hypothetical protein